MESAPSPPPEAPRVPRWLHAVELALALLCAGLFVLALTRGPAPGPEANHDPQRSDELAVLGPGHEREFLAMLEPATLGGEVSPGWRLWGVMLNRTHLELTVRGAGDAEAQLFVWPQVNAPSSRGCSRTRQFFLCRRGAPGPHDAALAALERNLLAHDVPLQWTAVPRTMAQRYPLLRALQRAASDGVVLGALALSLLLAVLAGQLAELPARARLALGGVALLGVALRALIALPVPMNAWSNVRTVPLVRLLWEGPLLPWCTRAFSLRVPLLGLLYNTDFVLACLTPLALFAHARLVLKHWKPALAAALLLAVAPMHVHFSRSDVEFLQSLLSSSLTFLVLYGALSNPRPAWRAVYLVALPCLCLATYFTRPENMVFFPLDLAAIALTARGEVPRRRALLASVLVTVSAAAAFVSMVRGSYAQQLGDGLSVRTLARAATILFNPRWNTLLNPWTMPPVFVALAVLGGRALWRRGERFRMVFLCAWLLGFFLVQSYVVPHRVAMQSRYHLHLLTPFLLLAASAVWSFEAWPRAVRWLVAVAVLSAPLVHLHYERDAAYVEVGEHLFLRDAHRLVPDGAVVLEYNAPRDPARRELHAASPLRRFALELRDGAERPRFTVLELADFEPGRGGARGDEQLSPPAREALERSNGDLWLYLGVGCTTQRPAGRPVVPVCREVAERYRLEPVRQTELRAQFYDRNTALHLGPQVANTAPGAPEVADFTPLPLGLYRVRGPR